MLIRKHISKLNTVGDTLVEVLLCVAIIALVLAAGYVTTNKSLTAERLAEERAQALQIAQGQLEALVYSVNNNQNYLNSSVANFPFCFDPYTTDAGAIPPVYTTPLAGSTPYNGCYFDRAGNLLNPQAANSAGILFGTFQVLIVNDPSTYDQSLLSSNNCNDFSSPTLMDHDDFQNSNTNGQVAIVVQWPTATGTLADHGQNNAEGSCDNLELVYRAS